MPELLRELADGGAISGETMAGDTASGPWIPLGQHPAAVGLFEPRPEYGLKATEFDRANMAGPPVDHRELIRLANQGYPVQVPGAQQSPRPPNDVEELVRATALANAAREAPMTFAPRENRRLRDFLFMILAGDGTGLILLLVFRHAPLAAFVVMGLMAIYTICLTWIMWGVMGRY